MEAESNPASHGPLLVVGNHAAGIKKGQKRLSSAVWFLLALVATFFTNLQPVPICAVVAPFSTLVLAETLSRRLHFIASSIPLGLALGASSYGYLFVPSLLVGVVLQLYLNVSYLCHRVIVHRHPDSSLASLAFPCVYTGLFVLSMLVLPIGSAVNPAYSFTEQAAVSQCAAIVGRNGVTFLVAWGASAGARLVVVGTADRSVRRGLRACLLVWAAVAFLGGVRMNAPRFFRDISDWDGAAPNRTHRVSCLSDVDMYQETQRRLAAGDTIVIHAERQTGGYSGAVTVSHYAELAERNYNSNGREAVIVLSFVDRGRSWYHLVTREGSQMSYAKNNPVPLIESDISPGRTPPSTVAITLGQQSATPVAVTGSICFDTDFPWVTRQMAGADLILETSETWYNIGEEHFQGHKYVALENGAMLVKCTSQGVTGVFDGLGNVLFKAPQTSGIVTFTVPRVPRVATVSWGGWVFDLVVACASAFWLVLCFRPNLSLRLLCSAEGASEDPENLRMP